MEFINNPGWDSFGRCARLALAQAQTRCCRTFSDLPASHVLQSAAMKTHTLLAFCLMALPATAMALPAAGAARRAGLDGAPGNRFLRGLLRAGGSNRLSYAASRCCTTFGTKRRSANSSKSPRADPSCAMAHWGVAMSLYHQIWDRPDAATVAKGWREMQAAQAHPAKSCARARVRGGIERLL